MFAGQIEERLGGFKLMNSFVLCAISCAVTTFCAYCYYYTSLADFCNKCVIMWHIYVYITNCSEASIPFAEISLTLCILYSSLGALVTERIKNLVIMTRVPIIPWHAMHTGSGESAAGSHWRLSRMQCRECQCASENVYNFVRLDMQGISLHLQAWPRLRLPVWPCTVTQLDLR